MPKIKCPHCGANNQDMTEKDRCWQCETVLGAPVSAAAEPIAPTVPISGPVQKQAEPVTPVPRPADSSSQSRFPVTPIAIGIVLLLIVLAILFFLMKK